MGVRLSLALAGLAVAAAASASTQPLRVTGITRIGGFAVDGSLTAARRAFGPAAAQTRHGGCELAWPKLGLRIEFYSLVYDDRCDPRSSFEAALVTGPWVTDRGLRRGDTLARARNLYEVSRVSLPFKFGSARTQTVLIRRSNPAIGEYGLGAVVKNGRVTGLLLLNPQGGE